MNIKSSPWQHQLFMTPSSQNHGGIDESFLNDYSDGDRKYQDVLMKISFSVKNDNLNAEECADILQSYVASFPFAAVLPVQPLTYTPRENGGRYRGVSVSFLRKKTKEKGQIDGGIEFLISVLDGEKLGLVGRANVIQLLAIRNTEGQTVSKVFSEGLIIKSFVSGLIVEDEEEGGRVGLGKDKLLECLSIQSFVHKWI